MANHTELEIVVLAAGKGTRMRSDKPKVLHRVAAKPMLAHVIDTARTLNPSKIHVVIGFGADSVREAFADASDIDFVVQKEQKGTGHAVLQAMPKVNADAAVLVLYGDVPLTEASTLKALVGSLDEHRLALLTVVLDDPAAYGRIVRDGNGRVKRIVEAKDAAPEELAINETNTGIMIAGAADLNTWLANLDTDNAQGEMYLTDVVANAAEIPSGVTATIAADEMSVMGVNSLPELAIIERAFQSRQTMNLMNAGVSFADPARFDLRGKLSVGSECFIDINVVIEGNVTLGNRVHIDPNVVIRDCVIGDGVTVHANSVLEGASVGNDCVLGPFARLRPEAELAENVRIGNFVEVKKSTLGKGAKANHLAYVGDSTVGANVNIGAGTITCNYDGANKHRTIMGDGAFIGSNSTLVAPVEIGPGAFIGAATTLSKNAPDGALTLARAKQVTIPGWRKPQKKVK